jgi:glycine/D-amino acid oxidase-like deaminating enzyme
MLLLPTTLLGLTSRPPPRTVGVIGGGIAGLSCARRLQQLGVECTVYDTGKRGPGGRASSRTWRGRAVDHAVQSVSAMPGSAFHEWLSQLEADGFVRPWSGLGVLGEGGAFMPAPEGGAPRYIGVGGMGTIAEQLAGGLDIRQDIWVSPNGGIFTERDSAEHGGGGWCVQESKKVQARYDAVVIAHNGKCAERLTSKIEARDVHMLLRARFATAATGGGPGGGRMTLNSMCSLHLPPTLTVAKPRTRPSPSPDPNPNPGQVLAPGRAAGRRDTRGARRRRRRVRGA